MYVYDAIKCNHYYTSHYRAHFGLPVGILLMNFAHELCSRYPLLSERSHMYYITNLCLFQREHGFIYLTDVEVEEAMFAKAIKESLKDDKTLEGILYKL